MGFSLWEWHHLYTGAILIALAVVLRRRKKTSYALITVGAVLIGDDISYYLLTGISPVCRVLASLWRVVFGN